MISTTIDQEIKQAMLAKDQAKLRGLITANMGLFNSGVFVEQNIPYTKAIPDVDVGADRYAVCLTGKNTCLGTSGIRSNLVVCGRGKNENGVTFLTLANTSSKVKSPSELMFLLNTELEARGCLKNSIGFYLIGGSLDAWGNSIESQEKFLELTGHFPIQGIRFNLVSSTQPESLSVVLTENEIYYSKMEGFFQTKPEQTWKGNEFWRTD